MRITLLLLLLMYTNISKATELSVVTELWPPYNYISPEGEIVGISTDIIKQTLATANIPYTLNVYPWARSYKMAQELENVLIYSIFKTPNREKLFQWICPLTPPVKHYAFKLHSRTDITIQNVEDLKKYKTSVARNTFPHELLKQHNFIEKKHYFVASNNLKNLDLLLEERVDIVIEAQNSITNRLVSAGLTPDYLDIGFEFEMADVGENCMAFSLQTDASVVEKVRAAHQKTLKKLHTKLQIPASI